MKHTAIDRAETAEADARYQAAMSSINLKHRRKPASGHAVMAALNSYGEAEAAGRGLAMIARLSRHFLIWFACVTPVLLVLRVAF